MIFNIGYLILVIALLVSLFGITVGVWGGIKRQLALVESSFNAVYAVAGLVIAASAILWYGLLNDRFEVAYVWNHSEKALPTFYKFAAMWGGQDGSLLFWCLILSIFSVATALNFRKTEMAMMPFVNAVMLCTSGFFLILLIFATNPFEQYGFLPEDGRGLTPLLQNYWMVIHPVMLYIGFVGLTVPFGFAVAALWSKKMSNQWVRTVRRWTLIPWLFLSAGILMGSQWAYMELGWGGYWAWDAVENASFLPWLTATAFLHSVLIQERRGILKVWNVVLIWATYFLVILGTFTTRSGLLNSVHTFAQSDVGWYFFGFLVLIAFAFPVLLVKRWDLLRNEGTIDSLLSREAAFLANNWLLVAITFAILWGTYFTMFSEIFTGEKISVAKPWFDKVVGPMLLALILLMGIGPLLGWRSTSIEGLRKQFTWPLLITLIFAAVYSFFSPRLYPMLGLSVCVLVTATITQEYVRGVLARRTSHPEENVFSALGQLLKRNGGRYGGYIVHLGVILIGIAIVGNEFYQSTTDVNLAVGQSADLAGYRFTYQGIEAERASNRDEFTASIEISDAANPSRIIGIAAAKRNYYDKTPEQPTSEVGLVMRPTEDLYVVLNAWQGQGESATITIYVNPLTMWMWVGGLVMMLGTLISTWPHPTGRKEVGVVPASQPAAA